MGGVFACMWTDSDTLLIHLHAGLLKGQQRFVLNHRESREGEPDWMGILVKGGNDSS